MTLLITLIINPLAYIVTVLLAVAFLTLIECKVLGYMQLCKVPNVVGPYALLQPIADGVKLFIKEPICPLTSSPPPLSHHPHTSLNPLMLWALMPFPHPMADLNLGMLFILALSSLAVYSILGLGWASTNSKCTLIGALRAVAQTISYEVSLGLILLSIVIFTGGFTLQMFNMTQEAVLLLIPAWPLTPMWYISTLAETSPASFDLTKGESELVSGFNVEYAGGSFALFFF